MTTATFPCGSILCEAIMVHDADYLLFSLFICHLSIEHGNELIAYKKGTNFEESSKSMRKLKLKMSSSKL